MKFIYVVTSLFMMIAMAGCSEKVEPTQENMQGLSFSKPTASVELRSWSEPAITTETYRKMFNEVASEISSIKWNSDAARLGMIDIGAAEVTMPSASRTRYGQGATGGVTDTPELVRTIGLIETRLESKRDEALRDALAKELEVHLTYDLGRLLAPNRKAVTILLQAGIMIEDLYMLQNHPMSMIFAKKLIESGDIDSLRFFKRVAGPTAVRFGSSPYANALRTFPDTMVGLPMWPAAMNDELFEKIEKKSREPEGRAFLSPYTVVKRTDAGELIWIPYGSYPPFVATLRAVARRIGEASRLPSIDSKFARQLALQSNALLSKQPFPYNVSDAAWTESMGELELIIGPYETRRDPYRTKAFYQYILGATDVDAMESAMRIEGMMPKIVADMSQFAPGAVEAGWDASMRLRAIEVIQANGFAAGEEGPQLAVILPNIGPASKPGQRKFVVMTNHHKAKLPLMKAIASTSLTADAVPYLKVKPFIWLTMLNALMYPLGVTPDGVEAASYKRLGRDADILQRAKAEAAAAWAAKYLRDEGMAGESELQGMYVAYVVNLLRRLRFGTSTNAGKAALLELSYLSWHGGLDITELAAGGRIVIDANRMNGVLRKMLAEITRTLSSGDKEGAAELIVAYPGRAPVWLVGIIERIKNEGVPYDVAVYYHTTGGHRNSKK